MPSLRTWIGLAVLLTAAGASSGQTPGAANPVQAKDMRLFQEWLSGRFDNQEQVYFQTQEDVKAARPAPRRQLILAPVVVPALSGPIFHAQRQDDNDPTRIGWQGLLRLAPAPDGTGIAMELHELRRPATVGDADLRLEALTAVDLVARLDCTLIWYRQGGQFTASAPNGKDCPLPALDKGEVGPALLLSAQDFWMAGPDQAGKPGISHRLRKARPFTCWMAIRTGDGPRDWQMRRDLTLHDQGGMVWFKTEGPEPREFGFKIRNVVWPSGPQEDSLALYVHERGNDRALSYAWADPQAKRIGINLRQVQGSCTLATDPARVTASVTGNER